MQKPTVLVILDGWGVAPAGPGNAIAQAKLKNIPKYWTDYPHAKLTASGAQVGLPDGEAGNTETGHINIGAGKIVYQDFLRINNAIGDGSFFKNESFIRAIEHATAKNSNIHLMGLISDAGVHSSRDHLYALLQLFQRLSCRRPVYLHLFTDGRDSSPAASIGFLDDVVKKCSETGQGKIATIMGRYYGMDRDRRWERTQKAYIALTEYRDRTASSYKEAIERSYAEGKTDEFIEPVILVGADGKPYPRIQSSDSVIFYNFRIDRPRQLSRAFILPDFEKRIASLTADEKDTRNTPFERTVKLTDLFFLTMTEYEKTLPCAVAFPPEHVLTPLGRVIADAGLKQLRMTETEKERFVTYYFNGMREEPFAGEDRIIVASPKVPTYDLTPDMSSRQLTEKVLTSLESGLYAFIVVNFPNPDLLGHTGNITAAIRACETVDAYVGEIVEKILGLNGSCIVTADHGNVEEMLRSDGGMDTEHSTNQVPFIMIHKTLAAYPYELPAGKLGDIAPTILSFLHIPVPSDMTGTNLLLGVPNKGGTL